MASSVGRPGQRRPDSDSRDLRRARYARPCVVIGIRTDARSGPIRRPLLHGGWHAALSTTIRRVSQRAVGSLLAIAAASLWGTSWVATGAALDHFSPFAVAAWRGIGSAALMIPLLATGWLGGGPGRPGFPRISGRGAIARLITLALLGGAGFVIGMSISIQLTGATMSAFVAGLYPVLAAAGAPLVLSERPSPAAMGGLAASFAGVLLLAGFDPSGFQPLGIGVGLGSAVVFAAFLLLARRWSETWALRAPVVALANFLALSAVATPLALAAGGGGLFPGGSDASDWLALGWLGLAAGVLANLAVIGSVQRLPARESSAYLLLNPLVAAILAALLLGERLAPVQVGGAILVLAGIAAATLLAARSADPFPEAPSGTQPVA